MTSSVYLIANRIDGKLYVGKSNDPERRWRQHRDAALKGHESRLCRAMRKHGVENFQFSVMEAYGSEDEAYEAERFWVRYLREQGLELYNLNDGGEGSVNPSPETRAKLSANSSMRRPEVAAKVRAALRGRQLSEKHREKISAGVSRAMTPEVRAKIGAACSGELSQMRRLEVREKIAASNRGKKRSDEAKTRMSTAHRGKKRGPLSEETRAKISAALSGRWARWRRDNDRPLKPGDEEMLANVYS